jgi:TonB family protein
MKRLFIISLVSICAYTTSFAQSKSAPKKAKITIQNNKKKLPPSTGESKFLPPEIKQDVEVEHIDKGYEKIISSPEPPPERVVEKMVEIEVPPVDEGRELVAPRPLSNQEYQERYGNIQAQYSAGNRTFFDMLSRRIKMPDAAKAKGIKGNVEVSFLVSINGVLEDIKVSNSLGYGCDEEAIRVIKSLGNWTPARKEGKFYVSTNSVSVAFGMPQERETMEHKADHTPAQADDNEEPPLDPEVKPMDNVQKQEQSEIFTAVEQQAEFIGGMSKFSDYLSKNLKYPAAAQRAKYSGKVYIQLVVNKDGTAQDIQVLKSAGFGCDEEALRCLQAIPKWSPGTQSGIPVRSRLTLPINFQLSE